MHSIGGILPDCPLLAFRFRLSASACPRSSGSLHAPLKRTSGVDIWLPLSVSADNHHLCCVAAERTHALAAALLRRYAAAAAPRRRSPLDYSRRSRNISVVIRGTLAAVASAVRAWQRCFGLPLVLDWRRMRRPSACFARERSGFPLGIVGRHGLVAAIAAPSPAAPRPAWLSHQQGPPCVQPPVSPFEAFASELVLASCRRALLRFHAPQRHTSQTWHLW